MARDGTALTNRLEIDRREFASAMKTFNVRSLPRSAMLAFEGGFLSIEAGNRLVTMRATGQWHGRAWFSGNLLKALAGTPPIDDPVLVIYHDAKLRIGPTMIACRWQLVSKALIKDVTNPSPLDLIALDLTLPRSEIHGTGLAKRIQDARARLAENIRMAAKLLKDAEISEEDLFDLAERRIRQRFEREQK